MFSRMLLFIMLGILFGMLFGMLFEMLRLLGLNRYHASPIKYISGRSSDILELIITG